MDWVFEEWDLFVFESHEFHRLYLGRFVLCDAFCRGVYRASGRMPGEWEEYVEPAGPFVACECIDAHVCVRVSDMEQSIDVRVRGGEEEFGSRTICFALEDFLDFPFALPSARYLVEIECHYVKTGGFS